MTTDYLNSTNTILLKSVIMRRLHTLFDRATANNRKAQDAYTPHVYKAVRSIPPIQKRMEVFIVREPAKQRTQKEKEDDIVQLKLLPTSYRPFRYSMWKGRD